ncbi:MAG: glycosyltransferase family 39 protein [Pirellulales bacterium]
MTDKFSSTEHDLWHLVRPLFFIVCALVLVHIVTIPMQSLFVDETEEIGFTREPLLDAVFMPDSMPPMFTVTLRAWLFLWQSDSAARHFSAFLSVLSTIACYWFVNRISGRRAAIVATVLFAFSPWQLYYAQLVRGYALMTFWAVLSIGSFWSAMMRQERWARRLFIASAALGSYSHYYFVMIPASLAVAWLIFGDRSRYREVLRMFALVALCSLPVSVFLPSDFQYQHDIRAARPLSIAAAGYTYFSYFSGYALGPSQRELQSGNFKQLIVGAIPWASVIGGALCMIGIAGRRTHLRNPLTGYCIVLCIVPLLLIGGLGAVSGITYNARFVAWFAFPMSVLLGLCFAERQESVDSGADKRSEEVPETQGSFGAVVSWCGLFLICSVMAIANFRRVADPRYQFEDIRSTAAHISRQGQESDAVFVIADYMSSPLGYYLGDRDRIVQLPVPDRKSQMVTDEASLEAAVRVVLEHRRSEDWLVVSRAFHADPDGLLVNELIRRGAVRLASYAGVELYRFPAPEPAVGN